MSKQKSVSSNGFNEFGGVSYVNRCGGTKTLSSQIVNTSLPSEGENEFSVDPSFVAISGGAGQTTLVTGVQGKEISVMSYTIVVDEASTLQVFSFGTSNTAMTGPMALAANGGISANDNEVIYRTQAGESLVVNNSAGNFAGHLAYKIG
jgi:hypothetical protein